MKHLLVATATLSPSMEALRQTLLMQGIELLASGATASGGPDWLTRLEPSVLPPVDIVLVEEGWLKADGLHSANPWLTGLLQLKTHPQLAQSSVMMIGEPSLSSQQMTDCLSAGLEEIIAPADLDNAPRFMHRLQRFFHHRQQLAQTHETNQQLLEINGELYDRNLAIENELYNARQLQQSLLPLALPEDSVLPGSATGPCFNRRHFESSRVRVSGLYLPCDSLGGDLYDVIPLPDGVLGLTIADVSGHGVPAGFVTALYKSSLYRMTHAHQLPHDILYHLNNEMSELVKTGDYITGLYCRLIEDSTRLQFSGAGHPYPLIFRAATQTIERLEENGPPLIWMPEMEYQMLEVPVFPGDKMLLFTDGVSEMQNLTDELFGEERLEALFRDLAMADRSPGEPAILDQLLQRLSDFTEGASLKDDLSMVLVELL